MRRYSEPGGGASRSSCPRTSRRRWSERASRGRSFRKSLVRAPSVQRSEHATKLMALAEEGDAARSAFWRTLGKLDEEVIIPIVVGGNWPARRQMWRVIHREHGRTLLVTHGLSDFFVV